MLSSGTSGRNAIQGFGGFNRSEHNIQHHRPPTPTNTNVEQSHIPKMFAGRNALNNPKSVSESVQKLRVGVNKEYDWRERTLPQDLPGQVAGGFGRLPYSSADTSLLQWKLHHGFGQNDHALLGLLDERSIAPKVRSDWQWQSDTYLHSDIGVPSAVNQNMIETPSYNHNLFPRSRKKLLRGQHDHTNLKEHHTPSLDNQSNVASGTHYTYGNPGQDVTNGFRATRGPLERPLLLSDLPQPPQPVPVV